MTLFPGPSHPLESAWPLDGWVMRVVQPYQARKQYRCPDCDHEVQPRTLHVVAWPDGDPGDRRHWHAPCWQRHVVRWRRGRRR